MCGLDTCVCIYYSERKSAYGEGGVGSERQGAREGVWGGDWEK